jgi:phage gp16-like protein
MKQVKTSADSNKIRRRDLALIHIAKKQLRLTDEQYRKILFEVTGFKSAAYLDMKERRALISHFRKMGFKAVHQTTRASGMNIKPAQDRIPILSKIGAILADLGLSWAYADGISKQMFGVDRVRWLKPDQLQKVMLALIYFKSRKETACQ